MKTPLGLALVALLAVSAGAEVRLAPVFSDHMVLQRGARVPIFGEAAPGAEVRVRFGGQAVAATAGADGRFRADLAPMDASAEGRTLAVETGADVLSLQDVLVGEVWLCSGQSNMEWPAEAVPDLAAAIESGADPGLRVVRLLARLEDAPDRRAAVDGRGIGTWQVAAPDTVRRFSAVALAFGRDLRLALGLPVGLIQNAVGGSPVEAWIPRATLAADPATAPMLDHPESSPLVHPWIQSELKTFFAAPRRGPGPQPRHPFEPSALYDAGIAPLAPFALRGAIWYQGESNAHDAALYETLFRRMVRDWRAAFECGDIPFLTVQLAGFGPGDTWPELRDAQRRCLDLPATGMAIAIDVGDPSDIHPTRKVEVGQRLALLARALAYGEDVPFRGPTRATVEPRGGELYVRFDHAAGLATTDGAAPLAFEVAGADGAFHAAGARIDGAGVALSSAAVPLPVRARYAWAANPPVNLVNGAGLPAEPFGP